MKSITIACNAAGNLVYLHCEVYHKQTYTPLFDRENFLPSPLFVFIDEFLQTRDFQEFQWFTSDNIVKLVSRT